MVVKSNSVVSIYDCESAKEIRSFQVPNLVAASLSPRGTYLQTFQKPAPQEKNVTLWKIETGDSIYQLSQKSMTRVNWYVLLNYCSIEHHNILNMKICQCLCRTATLVIMFSLFIFPNFYQCQHVSVWWCLCLCPCFILYESLREYSV